jgi:hypothetical protein
LQTQFARNGNKLAVIILSKGYDGKLSFEIVSKMAIMITSVIWTIDYMCIAKKMYLVTRLLQRYNAPRRG